jgi:sugar lactone lactonase YvrE
VVLPASANLSGPFTPTSDQLWLTITGVNNGVVSYSFLVNTGPSRTAHISLLGQTVAVTQSGPSFTLATPTRLEGPAAGSDSVVLAVIPNIVTWTASTNTPWLHLSQANQSGTGSANVVFSFDANPGATRSGTLTIAGQTLTVTQAGATYVAAGAVTTLVSSELFPGSAFGLNDPTTVVVDSAGNVYFDVLPNGDSFGFEWTAAGNSVSSELFGFAGTIGGFALDASGNFYIASDADYGNYLFEFTAANGYDYLVELFSGPTGVAVDGTGNVYIADTGNAAIQKWTAATQTLTTLVSAGLLSPIGVAVDAADNLYIADNGANAVYEWTAANSTLTPLVSSGLSNPTAVAVDVAGNVYIADTGHNAIKEWTAAGQSVTALVSTGLSGPAGVAVDGTGNVFIADSGNNAIKELPYAFVDPTSKSESAAAGSDTLPMVLPATENLGGPFTPASDQSWLTLAAPVSGVVSFSFTANNGASRTAHITVLDQVIPVTQAGSGVTPPTLTGAQMLGNGVIQFTFTNTPGGSFTVLSTTDLSLPLNEWTVVGTPVSVSPGVFQFTSEPASDPQRFYTVRSP